MSALDARVDLVADPANGRRCPRWPDPRDPNPRSACRGRSGTRRRNPSRRRRPRLGRPRRSAASGTDRSCRRRPRAAPRAPAGAIASPGVAAGRADADARHCGQLDQALRHQAPAGVVRRRRSRTVSLSSSRRSAARHGTTGSARSILRHMSSRPLTIAPCIPSATSWVNSTRSRSRSRRPRDQRRTRRATERPAMQPHVAAALGALGRSASRSSATTSLIPRRPPGLQHARHLGQHGGLVRREVDHAVRDHDVDRARPEAGSARSRP